MLLVKYAIFYKMKIQENIFPVFLKNMNKNTGQFLVEYV